MRKKFFILLFLPFLIFSWTERKLIAFFPSWNYWWLNTRLEINQFDTLYVAIARFNYSNNDPDHHLKIVSLDGDTIYKLDPWHGYEYMPIIKDRTQRNYYIDKPVLGQGAGDYWHMDCGVVDNENNIHTIAARDSSIYYTKLSPNGNRIYYRRVIATGDPWTGRSHMAIDQRGYLYVTWVDDIQHVILIKSTDGGTTWSNKETLSSISVSSHSLVICDRNNNFHIIWRTWTTGCQLHYMKFRSDGSLAIGNSIFAQGNETWAPSIAIDTNNYLHIVYSNGATSGNAIIYTVLNGNLDKNGEPATDSELTIIPDTIIQTDPVRIAHPKIVIDSYQRPHVIFEVGVYGNGTDKSVYHIRGDAVVNLKEKELSYIKKERKPKDTKIYDVLGRLRKEKKFKKGIYFKKDSNISKIIIYK